MRLIYDAPTPLPGLRGELLHPRPHPWGQPGLGQSWRASAQHCTSSLGSPCGVEPLLRREAFRHGGVTGIDAFPEDVYIDHLGFGEAFFRLHIHPF